ncbi:hypothetical protein [Rhodanobacter sp. DHB23]|uniref:hypothetical protein n=1 Tax=Rhodanobacter sp. DHB23 TaxID=2775923 RepID=UPI0017828C8F|nr:hypothetical protein [Rhodanobacter sp. DHB23]MBD8872300.1 hypothetical protein [Rhodanobacter sp. DHB23]
MPLPTDPHAPRPHAQRPAQVLLNSPLAASSRMLGLRASRRPGPQLAWRRVVALACSLLIHVLFLLGFTFVTEWEPPPGVDTPAKMQARFIELPDLAPPPPPKGEPPRQAGPVHLGHAAARSGAQHAASAAAHRAQPQPVVAAKAVAVAPAKVAAAPVPPPSVPQPAPTPKLQPVPVASQPPPVTLSRPTLQPPVPPKFQPQPVRPPQIEGNQPMLPPPSLALPAEPPQSPPTVTPPAVALDRVAPDTQVPAIVQAAHVDLPAAPPVPELQAVPLPAQVAPQVSLQTALAAPVPDVPRHLAKVQAPEPVEAPEQPLAAIPQSASATPSVTPSPRATVEIANDSSLTAIGQPTPVALPLGASTPASSGASTTASSTAADNAASEEAAGKPGESAAPDVSTAPNATPQGSDAARPGEPQGTTSASDVAAVHGHGPVNSHGLGHATSGEAGKGQGALPGTQSGAGIAGAGTASGDQATPDKVPEFVQLKPTGDTAVMRHDVNGVKYQATRFDPYWTPPGESSVDTALRHAAEKTTVQHTFHLPLGIRIKCSVTPLIPVSLLGCGNADAPPPAVAQKSYDRLNLPDVPGGSVPSMPPAAAATAGAPSRIVLDNSAQCAAARVAGGPPPPGCPPVEPMVKGHAPAASPRSWVPASDQFGPPSPIRAGQP